MQDSKWIMRDLRSKKTRTVGDFPSDNELVSFKDSLGYSAIEVVNEDYENHVVEFRPVDLSAKVPAPTIYGPDLYGVRSWVQHQLLG